MEYLLQYFYSALFYGAVTVGVLFLLFTCRNPLSALTTHFDPGKKAVQERIEGILDTSGKHQGWWIVTLVLLLCLFSGSFFSCEKTETNVPSAVPTEPKMQETTGMRSEETKYIPEEETVTTEPELYTASTLEEIRKYTDEGVWNEQVYRFLWNLLSGQSEIPEYNTVKITDSVLTFSIPLENYSIRWDFTVTESGLETLPPGEYHKEIRDIVECYLYDAEEYREIPTYKWAAYPEADMISSFMVYSHVWNTPTYGEGYKYPGMHNYLCEYYGDGKLPAEEYIRLAKEKFGADLTAEEIPIVFEEEGIPMAIAGGLGGDCSYSIKDVVRESDMTHVTVQYYADCNHLLPAGKVVHHITADGVFHGYDILEPFRYEPHEMQYAEDLPTNQ